MTEQRPCFACAHRRVGPMSGWAYCGAGLPSADYAVESMQYCDAMRRQGGACGPDARLFAPVLRTSDAPTMKAA